MTCRITDTTMNPKDVDFRPSQTCGCLAKFYATNLFTPSYFSLTTELAVLPLLSPPFSSPASRCKKSCHNSARLSLLLELLAMSIGSDIELSEGVEGVRRKGDMGSRKLDVAPEDVPGRARPACSRCSVGSLVSYGVWMG